MADDSQVSPVTREVLRAGALLLLPAITACACGAGVPSAPPARSPSHAPPASASPLRPPPASAAACQETFVPAFFYADSVWAQAIAARPAPRVMFLNVDSGPGTAPQPHFQALVRQAQAAGITVLGYSSTAYGRRPIGSLETQVRDYRAWYGVNGMFLDLVQGTAGDLPYYRELTSYIRATVPKAVIWLNPGDFPDRGYMSVGNVVMVFEGPYSSYRTTRVPGWVSRYQPGQFAHVVYATPRSELASAVRLSRARRAGHLFVTDLPGSPNPYGGLPGYWPAESAAIAGTC